MELHTQHAVVTVQTDLADAPEDQQALLRQLSRLAQKAADQGV